MTKDEAWNQLILRLADVGDIEIAIRNAGRNLAQWQTKKEKAVVDADNAQVDYANAVKEAAKTPEVLPAEPIAGTA